MCPVPNCEFARARPNPKRFGAHTLRDKFSFDELPFGWCEEHRQHVVNRGKREWILVTIEQRYVAKVAISVGD